MAYHLVHFHVHNIDPSLKAIADQNPTKDGQDLPSNQEEILTLLILVAITSTKVEKQLHILYAPHIEL